MALREALAKKGGLTLSQLASYDDLITDALVDQVYFWSSIRKNRGRYSACRGISEERVAAILQQHVVLDKDPAKAATELLKLPGLRSYFTRLSSQDERDHFLRHLRKYIQIYLPDCPFEVNTTNRYTISMPEAALTARKEIKKGEVIKYLTGIQVALTEKEEKTLDVTSRDFSIVMSSRKKTPSLFLGPARFSNHDCDANACLTTKGPNGMQVMATKDIKVGQEITVTYGDDYFGEDNCECLCETCEKLVRNGWTMSEKDTKEVGNRQSSVKDEANDDGPYSFRKKRKYALDDILLRSATPSDSPRKKQKQAAHAAPVAAPSPRAQRAAKRETIKVEHTVTTSVFDCPTLVVDGQPLEIAEQATAPPALATQETDITGSTAAGSEQGQPPSPFSPQTPQSTPATTVEDELSIPPEAKLSLSTEEILLDTIFTLPEGQSMHIKLGTSISVGDAVDCTTNYTEPETNRELVGSSETTIRSSEHQKTDDVVDAVNTPTASEHPRMPTPNTPPSVAGGMKPPPSKRQRMTKDPLSRGASATPSSVTPSEYDGPDRQRFPKDYVNTPLLLSQKYHRWNTCMTCDGSFVQPDAYQTRASCPRCERHSKLYGFQWPKTDREGRWDREERVLDHRTVNRFIAPEEEKLRKRRKRGDDEDDIVKQESEDENERPGNGWPARKKSAFAVRKMKATPAKKAPPAGKKGVDGAEKPKRGRPRKIRKTI